MPECERCGQVTQYGMCSCDNDSSPAQQVIEELWGKSDDYVSNAYQQEYHNTGRGWGEYI